MTKPALKLVAPTTVFPAVARKRPRRPKNSDLRTREYLTKDEVEALIGAVRDNRHSHRNSTMVLVAYRHGFRAAEICDLRWTEIDLDNARLHVRRVKKGMPSTHPIAGIARAAQA